MAVIATLNTVFSATTAGFDSAVSKARKSLGGFQSAIFSVKGALAGLGVGISLGKLTSELHESMESIDQMAKVSDRLGIATEALGGLRHAAALSGADIETMDMALTKMGVKMAEAAGGSKEAIATFKSLGLSASHLSTLSLDQVFLKVSDAINKLPTPAMRANAAMDIFGKSGASLLNTIAIGSEGLSAATKEFEALGGAVSRVDAAKVEAANDAMSRIGTVIDGIKNQLAIGLAPFIEASSKAFTDWASSGSSASGIVMAGIEGVGKTIGVVADVVDVLHDAFQFLQAGVTVVIGGIINNFAMMGKAIQELINATGVMEVTFGDTLQAMADGVMEQAGTEWEDAKKSFAAPPPSAGINKFFEDVKAQSQAAAEAAAANAKLTATVNQSGLAMFNLKNMRKDLKGIQAIFGNIKIAANKMASDSAKNIIDSTRTPLEEFKKTMSDLEALNTLGAFKDNQAAFERAKLGAFQDLEKATSAPSQKNVALERGTAAAFAAERDGKDNPQFKTQKEILAEAKRQTKVQEDQLKALKERGLVAVSF